MEKDEIKLPKNAIKKLSRVLEVKTQAKLNSECYIAHIFCQMAISTIDEIGSQLSKVVDVKTENKIFQIKNGYERYFQISHSELGAEFATEISNVKETLFKEEDCFNREHIDDLLACFFVAGHSFKKLNGTRLSCVKLSNLLVDVGKKADYNFEGHGRGKVQAIKVELCKHLNEIMEKRIYLKNLETEKENESERKILEVCVRFIKENFKEFEKIKMSLSKFQGLVISGDKDFKLKLKQFIKDTATELEIDSVKFTTRYMISAFIGCRLKVTEQ